MQLIEVTDAQTEKEFLQLPISIYASDTNWIRPLDKDIKAVFDPTKNKRFKTGEIIRWILKNKMGRVIGRVAAFTDPKLSFKNEFPVGGMGFFECENDQNAANTLFDACKTWLSNKGVEAMDGPVNFGERDAWWGLLVDGFTEEPSYRAAYNPAYYKQLFANYGFKTYFKQYTYARRVIDQVSPKYKENGQKVLDNPDFHFESMKKNEDDKYAKIFLDVYNKAWGNAHDGFKTMNLKTAKAIINAIKPIVDERVMYFGYYKDEPICMYLSLPELNQIFKDFDGKLNWLNKLRLAYHLKTGKSRKLYSFMFAVVPEFQGEGVNGALMLYAHNCLTKKYNKILYDNAELTWIGDFNPKMMKIAEAIGSSICKTHITYRKLFDPNRPFERYPIVGV